VLGRTIYIPSAYSAIDRTAVILVGLVFGILQAVGRFPNPFDAAMYWAQDLGHAYYGAWGPDVQYIYPPVLAQILTFLHPIGWPIFVVAWTTLIWTALAYILGRWTWFFVALGIVSMVTPLPYEASAVLGYSLNGNVELLITAGIVVGLRGYAAGWLPGLVTKVVPGVGLGWHLLRREWRPLVKALGLAAVVVVVSFAISPGQWVDWLAFTIRNADVPSPLVLEPVPLPVRLLTSLALLVWGARTNRIWVVPIVVGWCTPVLYQGTYPGIWIGAIPLFLDPQGYRR
jgi:hypothetical protein